MRKLQRYLCVSRPRRFGKSMAADMLAAYYDRSTDTDALFRNLKIGRSETYKKHRNQYDVIKINMQEFLSATSGIDEMNILFHISYQRVSIFYQFLHGSNHGTIDGLDINRCVPAGFR